MTSLSTPERNKPAESGGVDEHKAESPEDNPVSIRDPHGDANKDLDEASGELQRLIAGQYLLQEKIVTTEINLKVEEEKLKEAEEATVVSSEENLEAFERQKKIVDTLKNALKDWKEQFKRDQETMARLFQTRDSKSREYQTKYERAIQSQLSPPSPTSQSVSRSTYSPMKPKMGGLIDTYQGPEAWTGGKPNVKWTGLDMTAVVTPLPTQIRSNSSKAATAMIKRTEGLFSEESSKFKHGDDLDYFCLRVESHFGKHGLDSIAYRLKPNQVGNQEMLILFKHYPKFSLETVQKQNGTTFNNAYDDYDKQNDKDAVECFMNSINEELRKDLLAKIEDNMKFVEIFMIFIENERPQSGELYDTIERRVLNLEIGNFPGANIKDMAAEARKDIRALVKANAYDSKHNAKLCRLFTEAGGNNNSEYTTPMYQMLDKVKRKITEVSHLNNQEKLKAMSKFKVGWNDILKEAEENYKGMTTEGNIRWPPACNTTDLRAPATNFGANLIQTMGKNHKFKGKKGKFKKNGKNNKENGKFQKKKNSNDSNNKWKFQPPKSSDTPSGCKNGKPVYEKIVRGKKYFWCAKCGENGRWTLSHSTGGHKTNGQSENGVSNGDNGAVCRFNGQANIGEGLVPDARIWMAECSPFVHDSHKSKPSSNQNRRNRKQKQRKFNNKFQKKHKKKEKISKKMSKDCSNEVIPIDSSNQSDTENTYFIWTYILMMIGVILYFLVDEFCYLLELMFQWIARTGYIMMRCAGILPWYIWCAPILWVTLTVFAVKGRSILYRFYPEDSLAELQPEPRSVRRQYVRHVKRQHKKRAKVVRNLSSQHLTNIQQSDRAPTKYKFRNRKNIRQNGFRKERFRKERFRKEHFRKQQVQELTTARKEVLNAHKFYHNLYRQEANKLIDERLKEFVDKYKLEELRSTMRVDNYMAPAWAKSIADNEDTHSDSSSTRFTSDGKPLSPSSTHPVGTPIRGYTDCDWSLVNKRFDENENRGEVNIMSADLNIKEPIRVHMGKAHQPLKRKNDEVYIEYDYELMIFYETYDACMDELLLRNVRRNQKLSYQSKKDNTPSSKAKLLNVSRITPEHWTKVVLQHPTACHVAMDDTYHIVWDSGASMCITHDKEDFVGPVTPIVNTKVDGINSHLKLEGVGQVCWTLLDSAGNLRDIKLTAFYAPAARQRLLSTSVFCKEYPKNNIILNHDAWTIQPDSNSSEEAPIDILINPVNNLPMSVCMRQNSLSELAINFASHITTTHEYNFNLSEPQKEVLRWHYRLGHIGLRTVQHILRTGALAGSMAAERLHYRAGKLVRDNLPKCAACQFGKQINKPKPGKRTNVVKDKIGTLSADQLYAGQRVFVDHFICPTRGRKFSGTGIRQRKKKASVSDKAKSYSGGCIFVDAATGYIDVQLQSFFTKECTIEAVDQFEQNAKDHGIFVQQYQSDNGTQFTSQMFRQHLLDKGQTSRYAGAGSHHQNGRAERAIRTIMAMARTMMLHSAIHWPDVSDPTLWPMSVKLAVYIYNRMPNLKTGICPFDLWSKTRSEVYKLNDLHVFGCPVYVLRKELSNGKSIPRWEPRSDRGMYVGRSICHAGDVPLVLNMRTGYITAQWNVVFDDWFTTVASSVDDLPDFNQEEWAQMFGTSTYQAPPDEDAEDFDNTGPVTVKPKPEDENRYEEFDIPQEHVRTRSSKSRSKPSYVEMTRHSPKPTITKPDTLTNEPDQEVVKPTRKSSEIKVTPWAQPKKTPKRSESTLQSDPNTTSPSKVSNEVVLKPTKSEWTKVEKKTNKSKRMAEIPETEPTYERPKRKTRKPERLNYDALGGNLASTDVDDDGADFLVEEPLVDDMTIEHIANQCSVYLSSFGMECELDADFSPEIVACLTKLDELPPHSFAQVFKAANRKNPDILSYDEVLNDYDNLQAWLAAALKEINQLENKNVWVECHKEEANGQQIVPCTWVFRYKRNPAGEILKCKARICLRGDLMVDDSDSYAPVVMWSTIRFFLILALHMSWCTISVDWVNAFPQAVLDKPVFMQTPRGFMNRYGQDGCLKLLRSLYGSKFAPKNWYTYLRKALLKLGLRECPFDKCLFHRPGLLMILYVDDAGIAAPKREDVEHFVEELRNEGFDLEIEGEFTEYLGIGIEELEDGSRHMSQKGLIEKIIKNAKMTDCNPNWTPSTQVALASDPDGEPFDQKDFNYASIVGMLLYVSNNTRPDITFAVSQVARFSAAPKVSHARAIKSIVRYLARNPDKGLVIKLNGDYNLQCWVDADFAGLFGREKDSNPKSVKSRYGYVITLGGVPLVWKSKLISEICISTTHAEYVGLTNAMRTLIPVRGLIVDTLKQMDVELHHRPEMICEVFEDNQSAYLLATNQQLSVRTKYFCVKYHFFWQYVYHEEKNPNGWLMVQKCATDLMNADYLTKGLVRVKFEANRKRVQGW